MKKYVLIPDSFKGTLSSADICRIAAEEIRRLEPEAEIDAIPVADGGEGTADAFLTAVGGQRIDAPCTGPLGEPRTGHYALLPDGTAVVEMAAAAGLPLVGDARDPEKTTTYGVGELMAHALTHGAKRLVLGLGGSATNDGGCGAAAALGAVFYDEQGRAFVPAGGTLSRITRVQTEALHRTLGGIPVTVMCDIDNPLCGPEGAAAVFGPQKGADAAMVARLDAGLCHLAQVLARDLHVQVLSLPGGGAAGGFGAGAVAFFGGTLRMGIEVMLDTVDFDRRCRDARLVITGEGHLDSQSLRGKAVIGVARRAKALGVPTAVLVGGCETALDAVYAEGVSGVFPINPALCSYEEARLCGEENLRFTVGNLIRFLDSMCSASPGAAHRRRGESGLDTIQRQKDILRRELANVERALTPAEKSASDAAILRHAAETAAYRRARMVFAFVGRGDEIDTLPLLRRVLADGKRLCVPLCTAPGIMECREVTDLSVLRPGAYHILEPPAEAPLVAPADIDLAIVPCAGASLDGRRLGRGGGYYDRFLAGYAGETLLLCRQALLRPDIPWEAHDIPIPAVITEQGTPTS